MCYYYHYHRCCGGCHHVCHPCGCVHNHWYPVVTPVPPVVTLPLTVQVTVEAPPSLSKTKSDSNW